MTAVADVLAALGRLRVHDVSPALHGDTATWSRYEPPAITPLYTHDRDGFAANELRLAEHTGTHVDAPFHFDPGGLTIDQLDPAVLLLRPYRKLDLRARDYQPGELIEREALEATGVTLAPGDVAILQLGWDRFLPGGSEARERTWWGQNEPGLSEDACRWLADAGVAAVACDTGACDVACKDGEVSAIHGHGAHFLPRGILIVEALVGLDAVPDTGLFLALPLKIAGGTGSPVRVLLLTE